MMDRRYARHTGLTVRELKSGTLDAAGVRAVSDAHAKLKVIQGGITYQHSAGWTMERTIARLRQLKADNLCDVVVVDYLEKNASSRRQLQMFGNSTFQREADNVEQIKNFAEQTETPVVLLAQLSKSGKKSDFDDIDRTAMRGAGEKSEKANVVVILHRDKEDVGYSNLMSVKVDKNTLGATGSFKQYMRPETFNVNDLEEKYIPLSY
jgi:replicative DNA helicase